MNKEQAYDKRIAPLMTKIIKACKEHGISMLCNFAIPTPEDDGLQCTSALPDENGDTPQHHIAALKVIRRGGACAFAITITSGAIGQS